MTLNENSGMPPPRMSSSPRTPVGSWRIATLAGLLTAFFDGEDLAALFCFCMFCLRAGIQIVERNFLPDIAHQARGQTGADEGLQQSKQLGQQNDLAFAKFGRV